MTRIREFMTRVPHWAFFLVAMLVQVALVGLLVADRANILRKGTEVVLQTRPVDPRDFLRGDYVALAYTISAVDAGELQNKPSAGRGSVVFVKIAPNADGNYQAVSVHAEKVAVTPPERLIRGKVEIGATCGDDLRAFCARLDRITYGIERYFVPQGEGFEIEKARNQSKISIVAALTLDGRAAIKRLLVDGKPVYEEPLF